MARIPAPGTHERILDTASRLFYEHGVHAVGLQQVIDACGCGKNLLYREFTSKDDLIVAYLERSAEVWAAQVDEITQSLPSDPAAQLVAIVRAAAAKVIAPNYRGCPFLNVDAEFPDPCHPAHQAAAAHRQAMWLRLHELATEAGAGDPGRLVDRLILITDGMYANATLLGPRGAAEAVALAEEVIAAATQAAPERPANKTP